MRKLFVMAVLAALGTILVGMPQAYAFPPGEVPHVSDDCTTIEIDPPTWIKVTFTGTINDVPFTRSVAYDSITHAIINIADLTTAFGPIHIVVQADGGDFLGISPTTDVTLTCHESPTTTTAPSTTTSSVAASTTTATPTTTCDEPRGCCLAECNGPTTSTTAAVMTGGTEELPMTGSGPGLWPEIVGGAAILAIGNYFMRGWRRPNVR